MDSIITALDVADTSEPANVGDLRHQAKEIITSASTLPDTSRIPETNHSLLTTVIKPLFSKSHHPDLTSTGRKNLVATQPPIPLRFGEDSIFSPPPPWQTSWTIPLLQHILTSYISIPDPALHKHTLEAHFHLLVPPILHLIDSPSLPWKAHGCRCLDALCTQLASLDSLVLKRTGLTDVFTDALKNCFHYLPTLTPEHESLALFRALYPAYLAVVRARFVALDQLTRPTTSSEVLSPAQVSEEAVRRDKALTLLLRHSLLYGLEHLDVGSPGTQSVALCEFLVGQIGPVVRGMGTAACAHLRVVVPVLVRVLREPFGVAVPEVLEAAVGAMEACVQVCWVRIVDTGEKGGGWWVECLRGVVEGWLNVSDELEGVGDAERRDGLKRVMLRMRVLVALLEDVVGQEKFGAVKRRLLEEEPELKGLFGANGDTDTDTEK